MSETNLVSSFKVSHCHANEKLAFVIHAEYERFKILYRSQLESDDKTNKNEIKCENIIANIKVLILFIKSKVELKGKEEWCLVGTYNEALVSAIESNFSLQTRRLSESEALQQTIKYHDLPSINPSLTNVINATNLNDNLTLLLDNQDQYRSSRPPPNYFVDLKSIPMGDWRNKYMLASHKMEVPCLLLSFSDVSVLYLIDKKHQVRVIDHLSLNIQSIRAVLCKMLFPLTFETSFSFEKLIKMASDGDIEKVTVRWRDIAQDMKKDGYYNFPESCISFKLGKLSSSHSHDLKNVASGTLEFMVHNFVKLVIAHARIYDVDQVYACGDVFLYTYFREAFERLSLCNSIGFYVQGNKLLKTHVLDTPSYITALGPWLGGQN